MDIQRVPDIDNLHAFLAKDDPVVRISEAAAATKKFGDTFKTTLPPLDEAMGGGVQAGDLITVAGITGHGKTTFLQSMTHNFVAQAIPCLWFSYEVSIHHLWEKFKAMGAEDMFEAFIPKKMNSGKLMWVEQKIKEGILQHQTKVVCIDHLAFLLPDELSDGARISENYSAYLGHICRRLKQIAIAENIIIFLAAHVRKTDNPTLHDLRDSSAIAQESDFVILVKRELQKTLTNPRYGQPIAGNLYTNRTIIELAKNRRTGQTKFFTCELINGRLQIPLLPIYSVPESADEQPRF